MTDRCPTCAQPWTRPQRRVCADCGKPFLKGHKYRFTGSTIRHKDCAAPYGHTPAETPSPNTMELL